jgi:hypothetical protein
MISNLNGGYIPSYHKLIIDGGNWRCKRNKTISDCGREAIFAKEITASVI